MAGLAIAAFFLEVWGNHEACLDFSEGTQRTQKLKIY
jgi:hypothetical protein